MLQKKNVSNIKVSVCITIFNESEESVKKLLDALEKQTLKPEEVIVADATIITNYQAPIIKQYKNLNLKFINRTKVSRARGRNLAIQKARNEIVAITDAGCVPNRDWLGEITKPFEIASSQVPRNDTVVAGSYRMIAENGFQKAEGIFLGVKSSDMNSDFMPSARSMAFTKSIWKKAGGFPEKLGNTAEDTLFNVELIKAGAKFVTAKKAIVDWYLPKSIKDFALKIYGYAKGDAESGIWWHPVKKWRTHNLKIVTVFLRYFLAIWLYRNLEDVTGIYIIFGIYVIFAFRKAKIWGVLLQFISDFAVMAGFLRGILKLCVRI